MFDITILLYSRESAAPGTRVIQGRTGRIHGHALFNPKLGRMEYRLPYERYLEIAEDIELNKGRSLSRWVVLPEVTPVLEGREKELAEELATVQAERDQLRATLESLKTLGAPPAITPDPEPLDTTPAPTPVAPDVQTSEPTPDVPTSYEGLTFRQLRKIAREKGVPNLDTIRTSSEMIAAIESQPTPAP